MLTCPMCKKTVRLPSRECPTCRTDLSLLVDYAENLENGLAKAAALSRRGELGEAVWTYLAVLEVDPDNPEARRQVGQVAAAVRQFDRIAVGRRWLDRLQRQARFRHWVETWGQKGRELLWAVLLLGPLIAFAAGTVGWWLGFQYARGLPAGEPPPELLPEPAVEGDRP